ncbi:WGR domain-containing protein [Agrobacterium tumefaciens]|uniref:WGR domain-containing protein n=1 Tax=Agrobacterium tumefaciens TaxID=358 RepID=UPI0021D0EC91|nr:WGR domain-containing protein [Agrobacterium tumefaciens]UXS05546.1 WGR domain-containing protein [Agrobacterium tumefaciens]
MINVPPPFYAERIDASCNMARFYTIEISHDLFGHLWLERRWGRIGSRGQMKVEHLQNPEAIAERIETLVRQKTKRGYRPK